MTHPRLDAGDPLAITLTRAIQGGDIAELERLLAAHPGLARARIVDERGHERTPLHIATDWPGHFPNGAATIRTLAAAGAELDAPFVGPHAETPLHWAASSDDVVVLDALLDAGADIEAPGSIIGGGPPLADARAFKQWDAAFRLVERGARVALDDAATLGLLDRVEHYLDADAAPSRVAVSTAFWNACHGGRRSVAELLLARGAELDWIPPWERLTPLDAAEREGASDLAAWLRARGARSAREIEAA